MPGLAIEALDQGNGNYGHPKDGLTPERSPRSQLSPRSGRSGDTMDLAMDDVIGTSIEQLYHNVCEMQSSDGNSPSHASYGSYGEESRIDSELRHLAGDFGEDMSISKEVDKGSSCGSLSRKKEDSYLLDYRKKTVKSVKNQSEKSSPKSKFPSRRSPVDKQVDKNTRLVTKKPRNLAKSESEKKNNPDKGPLLLKQAKDMISTGENLHKALHLALQAVKSFERSENKKPGLDLVMCLHVVASIYCSLGKFNETVPVLERAIEIPVLDDGENHALAKFAGCMQLGDTYAYMGQIENSILCYTAGLEIQRQILGETDPRIGETCRYLAEAHIQALQFDEAEKLCQLALSIHKENGSLSSVEEAADRRLMGLVCDAKGEYEAALEHYVLASMAMASHNHNADVASIDCSIGDAYLSLARFDEAVFAYQKALAAFKQVKGDTHPSVASVFVRLADLYNKIGKLRDSKTYCENALRIYLKPNRGIPAEEIASGLIDISAIYQSMNELDQALKLLKMALKAFGDAPGQQSTMAGIEAQIGVICYMMDNYLESYNTFKSAISKFRSCGEKKSALFGIALNQMGIVCVKRFAINEAANLFEEAKSVLEKECGPYHPDTLGVYSNLAGTYDAMGRIDDAIGMLEYVVGMREDKLGTANPDVDDEKRRLSELLKEAGKIRNRKSRSLVNLLDTNIETIKNGVQVENKSKDRCLKVDFL